MSNDDQDALAAAWAAQLEEEEAGAAADPFEQAQAAAEEPSLDLPDTPAESEEEGAPTLPAQDDLMSSDSKDEDLASRWAEALEEDEHTAAQKTLTKNTLSTQASDAVFKNMTDIAKKPTVDGAKRELDFILDIPLDVSVELGRTRLLINELLQLGQGSVVELNKLAGEPLEVFVNGKLVARGEAVVINEKFGVRLTDIISPMERVKQLG